MTIHWYAISSHPNKEDALFSHMESLEVEVFYPCLKVNPVNPRSRKFRAYFPGYMFVHADLEKSGISFFNWMPHSKGIVSFGGEPSPVPDGLIVAIRQKVLEIAASGGESLAGINPGDTVVIENGPFAGYEAIFDERISGNERVRVLLKMLSSRQLPMEIKASSIRKKKPPSHN